MNRKIQRKKEYARTKPQIVVKINKILIATVSNTILCELNSKTNPGVLLSSTNFLTAVLAAHCLCNLAYSEGPLKLTAVQLCGQSVLFIIQINRLLLCGVGICF